MLIGVSCVYGQSVMSDVDFTSSASVVYLGSNPNLYLSDAKVRFYVSSKPEYRFEEEDSSEGYIDIGAYMRNKERPRYRNFKYRNGAVRDGADWDDTPKVKKHSALRNKMNSVAEDVLSFLLRH